ncbi:MAG: glycosyltransferase family 25 protein [Candidatus Paceibacterota bacterium]
MIQSFPIFVINLPIDVKKKEAVEKQLQALGAKYEFVDGIYGDDARVVERYDAVRAIEEHGKPLYFGEKGCAVAHALVYERIVQEKIPYAVILEDDIMLPADFILIIEKEINTKNKKWDWLSFDYRYDGITFLYHWFIATIITIQKKPLFFLYAIIKAPYIIALSIFEEVRSFFARKISWYASGKRFYRPLYNAGAYILTLEGAKKLLPFTQPLRLTADQVPNVARFKTNFNLYGYVPLIVKQNTVDFETGTGKSEEDWAKVVR